MNVFVLDPSPDVAASYHCDKHVVKMILETAQILSTVHRVLDPHLSARHDDMGLYKKTHVSHPSVRWTASGRVPYNWVSELGIRLCAEYEKRYGKVHASKKIIYLLHGALPENMKDEGRFDPPQCMPDQYKGDDVVEAYRRYYVGDKSYMARWKQGAPSWFVI